MTTGQITWRRGHHAADLVCRFCGCLCKEDEFYWDEMTGTLLLDDLMCKNCCINYEYDSGEGCYRRREDSNVLWKQKTPLHACVIETLKPFNDAMRADTKFVYFMCGLYQLDPVTNTRSGSVVLYRYSLPPPSRKNSCSVVTTINCSSGILDMKIANNLVFVALAEGTLCVYSLDATKTEEGGRSSGEISFSFDLVLSHSARDEGMFLSLSVLIFEGDTYRVYVSTQEGNVIICDVCANRAGKAGASAIIRPLHHFRGAHSYHNYNPQVPVKTSPISAWIVFADSKDHNRFATGGDDGFLRLWDIKHSTERPVYSSRKGDFTAGVTSGQFHPSSDKFAVGSYDDSISIYRGYGTECVRLTKVDVGGGVWRVKWLAKSYNQSFVISANMFGGSSIYCLSKTGSEKDNDHIVYEFDHVYTYKDSDAENSLIYGVDVLDHRVCAGRGDIFTLALCSFYDNNVMIVRSD